MVQGLSGFGTCPRATTGSAARVTKAAKAASPEIRNRTLIAPSLVVRLTIVRGGLRPDPSWEGLAGRRSPQGCAGRRRAKAAGRVRTEFKYGRDRERRLAAIQCGPAAQLMFRQVLP